MFFALRRFDYSPSRDVLLKLGKRVAIIFAIGLFLHAFPFNSPISELRVMGVLQRIALAYGLASAFVVLCRSKLGTRLAHPLRIYGMNPLFIYALSALWVSCYFLIPLEFAGEPMNAYQYLYRVCLALVVNPYAASVLFAGAHVLLFWGVAYLLYCKRIFIKI